MNSRNYTSTAPQIPTAPKVARTFTPRGADPLQHLGRTSRALEDGRWGTCPECGQSCTGSYMHKIGCSRCGWTAGIFIRGLSRIR